MSLFDKVPEIPPDAIFHTLGKARADTDPNKMNVCVGAYRTDEGKPYVLKVVDKVIKEMAVDPSLNHEYLKISGDPDFVAASQRLILGKDCPAFDEGRVTGVQALSGTGALRLVFTLLAQEFKNSTVYISKPTWGNHKKIIGKAGLKWAEYRYFDAKSCMLDFEGLMEDLTKAPDGSIVLLHACAHNPTGVDPNEAQWEKIAELCKKKSMIPFFDCAYQGYATGNLDKDGFAPRLFVKKGLEICIAQSYSKNLGLYGQRTGCASFVVNDKEKTKAIFSQLCGTIRPMYSNPPKFGAEIAKRVLTNPEYFDMWQKDLDYMSGRIVKMRKAIYDELKRLGTPGDWSHVVKQIGMFTYTGLSPEQCDLLTQKYHIYLLRNGRVSIAGVSTKNAGYLAKAIDDAVRNVK